MCMTSELQCIKKGKHELLTYLVMYTSNAALATHVKILGVSPLQLGYSHSWHARVHSHISLVEMRDGMG